MTTQRSRPADARAEPRERGGMLAVERPSPSLLDHRSGLHHTLGIAVEDQKAEFTHDAFHVGIAQREATPWALPKGDLSRAANSRSIKNGSPGSSKARR